MRCISNINQTIEILRHKSSQVMTESNRVYGDIHFDLFTIDRLIKVGCLNVGVAIRIAVIFSCISNEFLY